MRGNIFNNILSSLRSPVWGEHRIQNHLPAFMKRNPVIRKYGIGRMGLLRVFNNQYVNTIRSQRFNHSVEFGKRKLLYVSFRMKILLLKIIIYSSLVVETECDRLNHQNGM